jgi:hypothetical protein
MNFDWPDPREDGLVTTVLRRVPVERISEQAREIRVGRLLLTLAAGLLFALGWLVGAVFRALVWCAVAVKVGWQDGRKARRHDAAG